MRKAVTDPVYRHRLLQLIADAVLVAAAYWLAFALRFDQGIPDRYSDLLWQTIAFVTVGKVAIFAAFGLYQKWWRYVGLRDFESILKAVVTASLVMVGVLYVWSPTDSDLPRSIAVMDLLLTIALIGGSRLAVRSVLERPPRGAVLPKGQEVLIVGAGEGGQLIAREMQRTPGPALGASKAMAEWIVEALGHRNAKTVFCCVRFGNVLGSSGSVVPLFRGARSNGAAPLPSPIPTWSASS